MKKFGAGSIAIALAIVSLAFSKTVLSKNSSCGNYFWFRVQTSYFGECYLAQGYLEFVQDNGNGFPDEVFYGNDISASLNFGCYNGELYCCALGYSLNDIELMWPGIWRPKLWAYPRCQIYRD